MRAYPLIRRKWSNEHIMALLFGVLLLYLLPQWVSNPVEIPAFLTVLATALIIDATAGFLKHRRLVCSVSAAVTAGVLQILTPGIPLWGRLIGIAAAILIGKVFWGGTGKNTLNPAIVGYLAIYFLFGIGNAPIVPSAWLIPALVLSLPFVLFRPFASIGFIGGMAFSMFLNMPSAEWLTILVNSLFLGSIVLTDPVTITPLKLPGLAGAFLVGFLPMYLGNPALSLILSILIFNLISYLIDDYVYKPTKRLNYTGPVLKSITGGIDYSIAAIDLTGNGSRTVPVQEGIRNRTIRDQTASVSSKNINLEADDNRMEISDTSFEKLTSEQIIERIAENGVYGCGGAAFPAAKKIKAVCASGTDMKYLVINGVECDPGLVHDKWLLRNRTEEIYKGIKAVCSSTGITEVILAVKDPAGLKLSEGIRICKVDDYYPVGYEKFLIGNVLKKKLPDGVIPSNEGILVLNVQTLVMIYEAVFLNRKITTKYITISDIRAGKSAVVRVVTGTSIMKVVDAVFPGKQPVFTGGGAMQAHMADEDSLVETETNFIAASEMPRYKESPFCSGCGACEANCPMGLKIKRIAELTDKGKTDETGRYSPQKCIRCGLCSYICPAGRNLSARVGEAKIAASN